MGYNPVMKTSRVFELQSQDSKLAHAYLITGVLDGARIVEILKIKGPDLLEIRESPLKINTVRELIHWLALKPHSSPRKLAIIYGAETMTTDAANAFLKTLEEPPKDSVLILQAQKIERILPTIVSRCQLIKGEQAKKNALSPDYLTPELLSKKSLKERFDYAAKISESENLEEILNEWEEFFSRQLIDGRDSRTILRKIFRTRDLLLTNTSVKLLIENLLMDF